MAHGQQQEDHSLEHFIFTLLPFWHRALSMSSAASNWAYLADFAF